MDEMSFVLKMRDFVISRKNGMPFGPVSENVVQDAEKELGFSIPSLLRLCYLAVGNGGYGPGFGIIGLKGGYASDLGTLLETYESLHNLLLEARQLLKEATTPGRMESMCCCLSASLVVTYLHVSTWKTFNILSIRRKRASCGVRSTIFGSSLRCGWRA